MLMSNGQRRVPQENALARLLMSAQSPGMSSGAGMIQSGNINTGNRPQVPNADGGFSTVRSMSANFGDGEVLLPTVMDDGRGIVSEDEAIEHYLKTGRHLGVFDAPENADAFARRLHDDQARVYAPFRFSR
jgi:hypothetical protein